MRTSEISESIERKGLSRESSVDLKEQNPCSLWVDTGKHWTALVHQGRDYLSTSWHILEIITKIGPALHRINSGVTEVSTYPSNVIWDLSHDCEKEMFEKLKEQASSSLSAPCTMSSDTCSVAFFLNAKIEIPAWELQSYYSRKTGQLSSWTDQMLDIKFSLQRKLVESWILLASWY